MLRRPLSCTATSVQVGVLSGRGCILFRCGTTIGAAMRPTNVCLPVAWADRRIARFLVLVVLVLTSARCSSSGGSPSPAPTDGGPSGDSGMPGLNDADAGEPDGEAGSPPPFPACASALDRTTATLFYDAARCLFEGADPPQKGVAPGTIDRVRAAIVRGRVLDASQLPLAGTKIAILGHPEYGTTTSRADGWFDMAVNGGGQIAVRYEERR